jgi:uncharacterized membrane protein
MRTVTAKLERLQGNNLACLTFLFFFCFASFGLPLLSGLPSGYDMITDIRFASALRDGILSGEFFPGWANDNFGFGSIGIRFYPPVAFYVLAFTEMLGTDWYWALWSNLLFWMFLSTVGIFFFVKEWGTPAQGLIAGIGYAIVPQHLSEVFQFFLFAEFAAWAVIPFCFLFLTRVCRYGRLVDTVLFAISYSLLFLTHLPTTIIVSLCLPLYALVVMDWRNYLTIFSRLAAAIILTMAATAFRWVTIVAEFDWLQHNDPKWATGYFQYATWLFPNTLTSRDQFIYVLSSWLFDIAIVMTLALIVPAIIYLYKTRKDRWSDSWKIIAASASVSLFAFFMLSKPSQFVWEALPFLQKLQFPWRWLSVLSFAAVVAFALSVPRLLLLFAGAQRAIAYPALALVVTIILFNITQIIIPSAPIPLAKFDEVEEKVTREPMFEGWWPVWAKHDAFDNPQLVTAGGRAVDISRWDGLHREFTVGAGDPMSIRIATFYYPNWKAFVNHQPVSLEAANDGSILVSVPREYSVVSVTFEEPIRKTLAGGLSNVTWIAFAGFFITAGRKRTAKPLE